MIRRSSTLLCALGAAALSGCGASSFSAPAVPVATDPCLVTGDAASVLDTVRVSLLEPVDATHAPVAVNDSERLVFRQLYETLVRVDCRDHVRPALAVGWREEDGGRRWVFELAAEARFWDGTPVDAAALRAAWNAPPGLPVADVQPWGRGGVVVSLTAPRSIGAFGDPHWSAVKRIPESPWPVGTGPVWTPGWETHDGGRILYAAPAPTASAGTPVVAFHAARAADPRDALDQPVQVLVTRDAGAVRYARGRNDWRDVPLPWDRGYVLASPARLRTGATALLDSAAQRALADEAVRDDARAPTTHPWWEHAECTAPAPAAGASAGDTGGTIVAPAGDRVAMDLVARLVARPDEYLGPLLGERVDAPRAAPLDAGTYDARLAAGRALAFVVALPREPADRCGAVAALRDRLPWLADESAAPLVPLVETRAHLLLRDVPHVALDGDGGVRVVPGRRP